MNFLKGYDILDEIVLGWVFIVIGSGVCIIFCICVRDFVVI